jgi:hypothetical protein
MPIQQVAPHDFKAELKIGVNPPAREFAGAGRAHKAIALKLGFNRILTGGDEIEITGGVGAGRIELQGRAAHENGPGMPLSHKRVADAGE